MAAYRPGRRVNGAALLAPVAALYCGEQREWAARRAVAAAGVTLIVLMGATAANNPFGPVGGGFDLIPGLVAAALFAGLAASNRRAYIETVKARAEEDARRQVSAERLRIARELHDVVAHTMATINVQAGVAAHVLAERPEAAADALTAIKTASRDGLRELRAILHVLRQADETDDGSPTSRRRAWPSWTAWSRARAGPAWRPPTVRRPAAATVPGRRPDRVPDHPGVPDQRDPARRARHCRRPPGLPGYGTADRDRRHRAGHRRRRRASGWRADRPGRAGQRARDHRHAGAGRLRRR